MMPCTSGAAAAADVATCVWCWCVYFFLAPIDALHFQIDLFDFATILCARPTLSVFSFASSSLSICIQLPCEMSNEQ